MKRRRLPKSLEKEIGIAQCLIIEVSADPPPDPWHEEALRHAKRVITFVVGCTILVIGVLMIVLPGPAVLVIPFGLLVLGTEFVWARRLLRKIRRTVSPRKKKRRAALQKNESSSEKKIRNLPSVHPWREPKE